MFEFIKENYLCIFLVLFVIFFILQIVLSIYEEIQINKIPIQSGYVVDKYAVKGFDSPGLRVRMAYDVNYEGKVLTRVKIFSLNADQYANVKLGDTVYFDNNNKPIFIDVEEEKR